MFGINKKFNQMMKKSPKEGVEEVEKMMTTGVNGLFYRTFMGKEGFDQLNEGFAKAKNAADMAAAYQRGDLPGGLPATAEVISINDTGQMVNFDPIVTMQLKVQPETEAPFETMTGTLVSKIAVPRVGDIIKIKYDPNNRCHIVVIQE